MASPQLPPNPVSAGISNASATPTSAPPTLPPNPVGGTISGNTTAGRGPTASSGGGGGFGGFLHDVGHAITAPAHWVGQKLDKGAADVKQIGTGFYDIGKAGVEEGLHDPNAAAEWGALLHGHPIRSWQILGSSPAGHELQGALSSLTKGQYESVKGVVEHPLRDPFMDALWAAPAAHLGAEAGLKAAGRGALLDEPRMIAEPGRRPVSLMTSKNAGRRLVQAGIDRAVNHALASESDKGLLGREGPVAKYGRSRMGGTLAEIGRARIRFRQAMIANTRVAGRAVGQFARSIGHEVENPQLVSQALLHALHDNQLPEHEAIFHEQQAAKGVNPEQNTAWAKAFSDAARLGVVHLAEGDRVVVDPEHPLAEPLKKADASLEKIGAYGEEQLIARGLREPNDLTDRKARVSQLVQRGQPLQAPEPQALRDARRSVVNIRTKLDTANRREAEWMSKQKERVAEVAGTADPEKLALAQRYFDQAHAHLQSLEEQIAGSKPRQFSPGIAEGELPKAQLHASQSKQLLAEAQNGSGRVGGRSVDLGNPHRESIVTLGHQLEAAQSRLTSLEDRYGRSSPARRAAIQQGIVAREKLHAAAHTLFPPEEAAPRLEHIEQMARQYARANDVTPHEFYAHHLGQTEVSPTIEHLPEEIAPLYEAAKPLPPTQIAPVDSASVAQRIVDSGVNMPRGWDAAKVAETIDRVMPLIEEGAPYRDWYARAAAVIKEAATRLGVPLKRFLSLVAVTSQGANPTFNLRLAAKAAKEFAETGDVKETRYIFKQHEAREALEGKVVETAKRNNYYANFLAELDPKAFAKEFGESADMVTVDRHISRMIFGETKGSPGQYYQLAKMIFSELGKELGWTGREVQAAAWVPWKAMGMRDSALARAQKAGKLADASYQRFIPTAADAYEKGHAENLGVLYEHGPSGVQQILNGNAGTDLQGLPASVKVKGEPIQWHSYGPAQDIASGYMHQAGLPYDPPSVYAKVDPARAARIAEWYDAAQHAPEDPAVASAYAAMAHETLAQYKAIVDHGYTFEFYPEHDPYPGGPREAILDLINNKHMYVFPTDEGFGTIATETQHPLLADSGVRWGGKVVTHNDVFRAVHDFFGHAKEGVGFRADGEENAWRSHSAMYSPEARKAMTSETRGQNSWVNYGPHGEANRTASQLDTVYADQKAVLAPDWVVHDGAGDAGVEVPHSLQSEEGDVIRGSYEPATGAVRLSSEHATPETLLHEGMHAVRQSFSPVVEEIARRQYAPNGWDRAGEEAFVNDMLKAAHGEAVSPIAQRIYNMTSHWIAGRGYVPMTVWEDMRQSHSPMASSPGPIVGEAKSPMNTHFATGKATAEGLRRTDVAESVTSHWQKFMRFFNTLDHRELAAQHGGDFRMSKADTLVREDRRTEAGMKLPAGKVGTAVKEALDILENKTGLPAPEEEGLSAGVSEALRDMVGHIFPRLGTDPELLRIEHTAEVGTKAPAGYKWVPSEIARLKDLESAVTRGEHGRIGRFADNVNGAITAATVYYKIGHVFTRVFTNASTNIMQGSARPVEMARSWDVFHGLTHEEQQEALAYAGTHYYEAAPGATGSTVVGKGMQKGLHIPFTDKALRTKSGAAVMSPQWWAHHVDAPFRFNSIAFEARRAGYEGVDGFRRFLGEVRDYNTLDAERRAEVDGVLRRADREAIAYDRLNQFEKRFLSRAIWFYPWIKGSTVFTANTWLEHPFKAAFIGAMGQQGNEHTTSLLGDMPSYAHGLTPLTGGSEPVVSDFNTFNPFSTAADLIGTPEHIGNVGGMLNPALGAAVGTAESVNPYGAHTATPIWDNTKGLLASAPEYQIVNSLLDHGDQSHRLYPGGHGLDPLYKNWLGELVRALGSPATPRHVNPLAGHSLAERERTGR